MDRKCRSAKTAPFLRRAIFKQRPRLRYPHPLVKPQPATQTPEAPRRQPGIDVSSACLCQAWRLIHGPLTTSMETDTDTDRNAPQSCESTAHRPCQHHPQLPHCCADCRWLSCLRARNARGHQHALKHCSQPEAMSQGKNKQKLRSIKQYAQEHQEAMLQGAEHTNRPREEEARLRPLSTIEPRPLCSDKNQGAPPARADTSHQRLGLCRLSALRRPPKTAHTTY